MLKNSVVALCVIFAQALAGPETAVSQVHPGGVTFRDFNAEVYLTPVDVSKQLGIGWVNSDVFPWGGIEPQKGQWNWGPTDQKVQNTHSEGVEILPTLGYTAPWAQSVPGLQWSPPKSVQDWEDYAEHVVAHYSSPPFNLRYFRIWNEPTRDAGFWLGTDQQFVDMVYLPAAKVIRQHHCFVVFGGWGLGDSLQRFDQLLEYHDAWRWTDILDVHYREVPAWQQLYTEWIKTGKCRGIWDTEIGYTADVDYLPSTYLRLLSWALQSGWRDPDQYKVFWYTGWGNGPQKLACLTMPVGGNNFTLSPNGTELKTMNDVLGAGALASFRGFSAGSLAAGAVSGAAPSALGFKVGGDRIVIALLSNQATPPANSAIPVVMSLEHRPQQVQLVSVSGERKVLPVSYSDGKLTVSVPRDDLQMDCATCKWAIAYLEVDGA
jgi:hypothetical protein